MWGDIDRDLKTVLGLAESVRITIQLDQDENDVYIRL